MNLTTARLLLVPATADLAALEIQRDGEFARALHAEVPAEWPPEELADALPWFLEQLKTNPELVGWLGWYGLLVRDNDKLPVLVGSGGFFGLPQEGVVEVGYSVLPEFQNQGYATEMIGALVEWAKSQPGVRGVVAEAHSDNPASKRVLEKLGFQVVGEGREPGHQHYEQIGSVQRE